MKVLFNFSPKTLTRNYDSIKQTQKTILNNGHELVANKIAEYSNYAEENHDALLYEKTMSEILIADLIIFECTDENTSIGFQIAFSLLRNKPTLVLTKKSKEKVKQLFINGSQSPQLTIKHYTSNTIDKILSDYFKTNAEEKRIRFNLVIDKKQDNYIEWSSFNQNTSKTEIIKKAINEMMDMDQNYKNELH